MDGSGRGWLSTSDRIVCEHLGAFRRVEVCFQFVSSSLSVPSESIRDHLLFWESFRSISRMDARRRNARALRFKHSQSLASGGTG